MHQLQQIAHCGAPIHHPPLENWLQQDLFEPLVAQELLAVNLLHSPTCTIFLHLFGTKKSVKSTYVIYYTATIRKPERIASNYEAQVVGCEGCLQNQGLSHAAALCIEVCVCVWEREREREREVATLKFEPEPLIWVMGFQLDLATLTYTFQSSVRFLLHLFLWHWLGIRLVVTCLQTNWKHINHEKVHHSY